jgi:hypothetical protein
MSSRFMKTPLFAIALLIAVPGQVRAQDTAAAGWKFSTSVSAYVFPSDETYFLPILYADRDWLHLEARYNYEARETGSLFVGRKFTWESGKLEGEVTPMVGLVLGEVDGVAPGLELDLLIDPVEFYTEGEFMMDFGEGGSSFFYFWSELTVWPTEWLNAGLVSQRTRAVDTQLDFQRGFLAGLSHEGFGFTFYMFNLDEEEPYYVFTLKAAF